ncbi:hypothetical protein [Stenotrophomonas sp.]|uniref:hypothetical protein n=1 Tax=Stenotrophomonas sp. TaxID=69392 RepID=UPI0028A7FBA4|nr:hypothetical protein [Stenotrophomonas sp.]
MKHHYADFLDRTGDTWTLTPNAQRWSCHVDDLVDVPDDIERLMVTAGDRNWERMLQLPLLRELTLHEPSQAQLASLAQLPQLTALRISHARPKMLAMLEGMQALRELVLEYVSGFNDLSPVGRLPALSALHLENLRRVSDFSGLAGAPALRNLAVMGTLDWNQPVADPGFLAKLPALEAVSITWFRSPLVSGLPGALLRVPKLRKVHFSMSELPLEDFARIQAWLPNVEGAVREPFVLCGENQRVIDPREEAAALPLEAFLAVPGFWVDAQGRRREHLADSAYLLGKGERMAQGRSASVLARCGQHAQRYRALVEQFIGEGVPGP